MTPSQTLAAFFAEMASWERTCFREARKALGPGAAMLDLAKHSRESRNAVLERFCDPAASDLPFTQGTPTRYDPAREQFVSEQVSPDGQTATVETACRDPKQKIHVGYAWQYDLRRYNDGWRIERRRVKYPSEKRFESITLA